jgi:hypothetical protein
MSMSMQGQELFISTMAKVVVDVAIQNNPEYNKFMDGIISSLITMAKVEKLLDDDEIEIAINIINSRAKEILQIINMGNIENENDIDDIINRALNSGKE